MSTNVSTKLTPEELRIVTRIAVFRGLKPDTVEHILVPATAVMVKPQNGSFGKASNLPTFSLSWLDEAFAYHGLRRGDGDPYSGSTASYEDG